MRNPIAHPPPLLAFILVAALPALAAPATPPAATVASSKTVMSEQDAALRHATTLEQRFRHRLARLRRLRALAGQSGDEDRLEALGGLYRRYQQAHERALRRLEPMLSTETRRSLRMALAEGRRPDPWPEARSSASRHVRFPDLEKELVARRAVSRPASGSAGPRARPVRVADPRRARSSARDDRRHPGLLPRRLPSQREADAKAAAAITSDNAELEFQRLRREIEREERD